MFRHHGLRVRGPMLRDDPATGGAGGADSTAGGGGAPVPPPAPPAPAGTPPAADVTTTPEYKAALARATADIEAKARTGTKANAQKEIFETLAVALGQKTADVDPAAIGAELVKARADNARLLTESAVGRSARTAGGDEDMVTAWLAHKCKAEMAALDPTAADFSAKVDALVKAQIEANPKLKSGTAAAAPPVTPGRAGAAGSTTSSGAGEAGRPNMADALAKAMAR